MGPSPTGLLIIRVWIESGSSEPLRAHLRCCTDIAAGFERELTLVHADGVSAAVNAWLSDYLVTAHPDLPA